RARRGPGAAARGPGRGGGRAAPDRAPAQLETITDQEGSMTAQRRPDPATPLRLVPQPRAAIYARVSDPKQESNYSLPSQEAAMRAYCAEQGYRLDEAHVYREVHTASE